MRKQGFSLGDISKPLNCLKSIVQYFVNNFFRGGFVVSRIGRGRPRITTDKEDGIIGRIIKNNRRKSAKKVRTATKNYHSISISPSTIRTGLHDMWLYWRVERKKSHFL